MNITSWLQYDFMRNALIAVLIITPLFGIMGTMIVNKKMAYFSDALGHSALTGIAVGVVCGMADTSLAMVIFAIVFALLLNEIKSLPLKKITQTVSYLPHFLSWIIVCSLISKMLSTNDGAVNNVLMKLGLIKEPLLFLGDQKYFWWITTFANIWKETGWNAIIYLAAITSIDPCLYEAASIDGAGRWAKIKYITLPGIKPTIMILLLMNVGNVLNAGFEVQYLLGNGLVQKVSQTIDIYVLKWGISQGDFAIGTAAGIFKSFVSIILIVIANQIAKRNGEEQLF